MRETRRRIAEMDKKSLAVTVADSDPDATDVIREVNAILHSGQQPLAVINQLAKRLPEGSFVNRMALTTNTLDLRITAKDPLTVVRSLGSDPIVKKATMKGSPTRDKGKGLFSFSLTLELVQ
jgi:hypothetical protein